MIKGIFVSILFSLVFSISISAQYSKEIINPYVNASEREWLKSKRIDLSYYQIKDKEFIRNVRLLLDLKTQNNQALGKFSGLIAISVFSLVTYRLGDYDETTGALTNTLLGTVGVTTACLATKYYLDHNNLSSQKNQLLRLTQNQYKLLLQ